MKQNFSVERVIKITNWKTDQASEGAVAMTRTWSGRGDDTNGGTALNDEDANDVDKADCCCCCCTGSTLAYTQHLPYQW